MKNKIININCERGKLNNVRLVKPYFEFVRFRAWGGAGLFSEFTFRLVPSEKLLFTLNIKCKKEEMSMVEKGATEAITKLIKKFQDRGLNLLPFEILLTNYRIHPIDTLPVCFEIPIKKRIEELILDEDIFRIDVNSDAKNSIYIFEPLPFSNSFNFSNSFIVQTLPWLNDETLVIKDSWKINLETDGVGSYSEKSRMEVIIKPSFDTISTKGLSLEIDTKMSHSLVASITTEINKFVKYIYSEGYNLGNLHIEVKEVSKDDINIRDRVFNPLRIALLELINETNNWIIKETIPM